MFLQTVHVLSDFQVGNFSINLCRSNVAVSQHLAERFHCYTIERQMVVAKVWRAM